jgi:hypothetical protein
MKRLILIISCLLLPGIAMAGFGMQMQTATSGAPAAGLTRSDNFNRSDEHPLGNSDWTKDTVRTALKIVSNQVVPSSGWGMSYWSADSFGADQYSQVKIVTNSNTDHDGPVVRQNNNVGGMINYRAYVSFGSVAISRTNLTNSASSGGMCSGVSINGKVLKLTVSGTGTATTLRVYVDGVECGSGWTDNSANAISSGQPAIMADSTGVLDDWQAGEL